MSKRKKVSDEWVSSFVDSLPKPQPTASFGPLSVAEVEWAQREVSQRRKYWHVVSNLKARIANLDAQIHTVEELYRQERELMFAARDKELELLKIEAQQAPDKEAFHVSVVPTTTQ